MERLLEVGLVGVLAIGPRRGEVRGGSVGAVLALGGRVCGSLLGGGGLCGGVLLGDLALGLGGFGGGLSGSLLVERLLRLGGGLLIERALRLLVGGLFVERLLRMGVLALPTRGGLWLQDRRGGGLGRPVGALERATLGLREAPWVDRCNRRRDRRANTIAVS